VSIASNHEINCVYHRGRHSHGILHFNRVCFFIRPSIITCLSVPPIAFVTVSVLLLFHIRPIVVPSIRSLIISDPPISSSAQRPIDNNETSLIFRLRTSRNRHHSCHLPLPHRTFQTHLSRQRCRNCGRESGRGIWGRFRGIWGGIEEDSWGVFQGLRRRGSGGEESEGEEDQARGWGLVAVDDVTSWKEVMYSIMRRVFNLCYRFQVFFKSYQKVNRTIFVLMSYLIFRGTQTEGMRNLLHSACIGFESDITAMWDSILFLLGWRHSNDYSFCHQPQTLCHSIVPWGVESQRLEHFFFHI